LPKGGIPPFGKEGIGEISEENDCSIMDSLILVKIPLLEKISNSKKRRGFLASSYVFRYNAWKKEKK